MAQHRRESADWVSGSMIDDLGHGNGDRCDMSTIKNYSTRRKWIVKALCTGSLKLA
jgi:hypothetical protein